VHLCVVLAHPSLRSERPLARRAVESHVGVADQFSVTGSPAGVKLNGGFGRFRPVDVASAGAAVLAY